MFNIINKCHGFFLNKLNFDINNMLLFELTYRRFNESIDYFFLISINNFEK